MTMRYRDAGVDIETSDRAVRSIRDRISSTFGPDVVTGLGDFAGVCAIPRRDGEQLLVASMDGVGTKLQVAARAGRYDTVGEDLVNHCTGDIGVCGAEPLFFLDYVGMGRLEPAVLEAVVEGLVRGCRANDCALIGGETAEMPGTYAPGDLDLVGCIVGTVSRGDWVDGSTIRPGDALLGLPSTGLHTNGYSLARAVLFDTMGLGPDDPLPGTGTSVGEALLAVHRSYLEPLRALRGVLKGAAHITGGGLPGNLRRILPAGTSARVDRAAWRVPPVFRAIAEGGGVPEDDLYRTFNMGVGMVFAVDADHAEEGADRLGEETIRVGTVVEGDGTVELTGDIRW
jgi:phosphoribosylformylglycinamidine cyclo-ligase